MTKVKVAPLKDIQKHKILKMTSECIKIVPTIFATLKWYKEAIEKGKLVKLQKKQKITTRTITLSTTKTHICPQRNYKEGVKTDKWSKIPP